MQKIIRLLAPPIAAVFVWLLTAEIGPVPPDSAIWKFIGLAIPALWLTSVGPRGLLERGGFVMQTFGIRSTKQRVALIGLCWLMLFMGCSYVLSSHVALDSFFARLLYCLQSAGLMSALGVYAFLAAIPETTVERNQ